MLTHFPAKFLVNFAGMLAPRINIRTNHFQSPSLPTSLGKVISGYMSTVNARPLAEILTAMTSKSEADVALVTKAYDFSQKAHEGQKRYSGDPYFIHPAEVGYLLASAGLD